MSFLEFIFCGIADLFGIGVDCTKAPNPVKFVIKWVGCIAIVALGIYLSVKLGLI